MQTAFSLLTFVSSFFSNEQILPLWSEDKNKNHCKLLFWRIGKGPAEGRGSGLERPGGGVGCSGTPSRSLFSSPSSSPTAFLGFSGRQGGRKALGTGKPLERDGCLMVNGEQVRWVPLWLWVFKTSAGPSPRGRAGVRLGRGRAGTRVILPQGRLSV